MFVGLQAVAYWDGLQIIIRKSSLFNQQINTNYFQPGIIKSAQTLFQTTNIVGFFEEFQYFLYMHKMVLISSAED
jgi:hypothetical protein